MYKVVRHFYNNGRKRTIKKGLTLEEAQAHCKDTETSSRTATGARAKRYTLAFGPWLDSYDKE